MRKDVLERNELYDLVWSKPLSHLTETYQIPSEEFYTICAKMNIPIPDNDYWLKLENKEPVSKQELPYIVVLANQPSVTQIDMLSVKRKYENAKHKDLVNNIIDSPNLPLKVPEKLTNPDPLIVIAKMALLNAKISPYSNDLIFTPAGVLRIIVAPKNIDRALRIFNSILKLLHIKNYEVIISDYDTYVIIQNRKYKIYLREKIGMVKSLDLKPYYNKYSPTGILTFRIDKGYSGTWQDDSTLLENKLHLILAGFDKLTEKVKEQNIYFQKNFELEQIKKKQEEIKVQELRLFKNLINQSIQWQQAIVLENFIKEIENKALSEGNLTEDQIKWLDWARQKAKWFNPLEKKPDTILNDTDRENLYESENKSPFYFKGKF